MANKKRTRLPASKSGKAKAAYHRKRARRPGPSGQPSRHDFDPHPLDFASTVFEREMRGCEEAWRGGSVPALVDALVRSHEAREPIPLWLAQGAITLIKMLFTGKSLQQRGRLGAATTRYRSYLIDYARWDAVKDLEDRRDEILTLIAHYSGTGQLSNRPQLLALAQDYTLEQRSAAVAELFNLSDNPAKGSDATILRSYKRVNRDMRRRTASRYYLPGITNPLYSTYVPPS